MRGVVDRRSFYGKCIFCNERNIWNVIKLQLISCSKFYFCSEYSRQISWCLTSHFLIIENISSNFNPLSPRFIILIMPMSCLFPAYIIIIMLYNLSDCVVYCFPNWCYPADCPVIPLFNGVTTQSYFFTKLLFSCWTCNLSLMLSVLKCYWTELLAFLTGVTLQNVLSYMFQCYHRVICFLNWCTEWYPFYSVATESYQVS